MLDILLLLLLVENSNSNSGSGSNIKAMSDELSCHSSTFTTYVTQKEMDKQQQQEEATKISKSYDIKKCHSKR